MQYFNCCFAKSKCLEKFRQLDNKKIKNTICKKFNSFRRVLKVEYRSEQNMMTIYKYDSPDLQIIWQKLYADNPYLFPYSSWEYNEQVYKYMKIKPSLIYQKQYFVVYEEEQKPLVIFPLFVKKNVLQLFGENISGAGHLDVLYDAAITTKQLECAFGELKNLFSGKTLRLRMINERSKLCHFLQNMTEAGGDAKYSVKADEERVCVKILFPDSYEEYERGGCHVMPVPTYIKHIAKFEGII